VVEKKLLERQRDSVEQRMLLMQMNPHFLFNALNSVNNYIGLNETAKAQEFLLKLSRLTRQILDNSRRQFIPLDEEIKSLELYIGLEQERFGNSYVYKLEIVVDETEFILIPPMLVQPFVENAIIHGLAGKQKDGELLIRFQEEGSLIRITVQDNGSGRLGEGKDKKVEGRGWKVEEIGEKPDGGWWKKEDGSRHPEQGTPKSHTSLGSSLVADRIALLRQELNCDASLTYSDLKDASGNPCGTKVELRLPYKVRED
jgi:LytS/YehU family sensor histidine kinase